MMFRRQKYLGIALLLLASWSASAQSDWIDQIQGQNPVGEVDFDGWPDGLDGGMTGSKANLGWDSLIGGENKAIPFPVGGLDRLTGPRDDEFLVSGQAALIVVGTVGSGPGGSIDVAMGVNVDPGDGYHGDLSRSVVLEPGVYRYRYVGIDGGDLSTNDEYVTITVRGQGRIIIHCQHNFMADVKVDYSMGIPSVEIYAGEPLPIPCYGAGRHIGTGRLPHAVFCDMVGKDMDDLSEGGSFTFHTVYEGDLDVVAASMSETGQGGSIRVLNEAGDVRGIAVTGGELDIAAYSIPGQTSTIKGVFLDGESLANIEELLTGMPQPKGLYADRLELYPLGTSPVFEFPIGDDVKTNLLPSMFPDRPATAGILSEVVDVSAPSGTSAGDIDVKTGVFVDTGDGSDGPVTESRILEPGTYDFTFVCAGPDEPNGIVLLIKGDITLRCQYLFSADICVHPACEETPKIEVFAGTPVVPDRPADPSWLWFFVSHNWHGFSAYGMRHGPDFEVKQRIWDLLVAEGWNPNWDATDFTTPGFGAVAFKTRAHGTLQADQVLALTVQDSTFGSFAGAGNGGDGGKVILMASRGDIEVHTVDASGETLLLQQGTAGHGGEIYCRAGNIVVNDCLAAVGGGATLGSGGKGGNIYCEAVRHDSGEPGKVHLSASDSSIKVTGGDSFLVPGAGGNITLMSLPVSENRLDIRGGRNDLTYPATYGPSGTLNAWWPDLATIFEH